MSFRVSKDAAEDLDEIFLYWARRASPRVADRLIDAIAERFWLLGEYPDAGKTAANMGSGAKCFPAGRCLIYYRGSRHGMEILHVFHGAREQVRAFRKPKRS